MSSPRKEILAGGVEPGLGECLVTLPKTAKEISSFIEDNMEYIYRLLMKDMKIRFPKNSFEEIHDAVTSTLIGIKSPSAQRIRNNIELFSRQSNHIFDDVVLYAKTSCASLICAVNRKYLKSKRTIGLEDAFKGIDEDQIYSLKLTTPPEQEVVVFMKQVLLRSGLSSPEKHLISLMFDAASIGEMASELGWSISAVRATRIKLQNVFKSAGLDGRSEYVAVDSLASRLSFDDINALSDDEVQDLLIRILHATDGSKLKCPKCGGTNISQWKSRRGNKNEFRCKSCLRYMSIYSGTPLAKTRFSDRIILKAIYIFGSSEETVNISKISACLRIGWDAARLLSKKISSLSLSVGQEPPKIKRYRPPKMFIEKQIVQESLL